MERSPRLPLAWQRALKAVALSLSSCAEGEGACLGKQPNEQKKLRKKKIEEKQMFTSKTQAACVVWFLSGRLPHVSADVASMVCTVQESAIAVTKLACRPT